MDSKYLKFYEILKDEFENRIFIDYLRRFAYGTDASCYRYIPNIVIKAINEDEIIRILKLSYELDLEITFRASGSSLSGQACGNGILVIATFGWSEIEILKDSIKLGCGVIGSDANAELKSLNKKIGPDPATITMARIGGIISNNSSGMCCGVKQNSYQTIKNIRVILRDGEILDTADKNSVENFLKTHEKMVSEILNLRNEILGDEELKALISRKYRIKNTTGYSLNALLDFENIIDILMHLFVGAEGTLGFISNATLEIVDDERFKACALLFYKDISEASRAVQILAKHEEIISSAEIMDYYSLKSAQNLEGLPSFINEIKEGNTCILLQTQNNSESMLDSQIERIKRALEATNPVFAPLYSKEESEFNKWWNIRKGLLPIASSLREKGSSVITEDICFEIDKLGVGIELIQNLFKKYDFLGIIFGHALSGNVHFIITPNLSDARQKKNFESFIDEMAREVAKLNGSIKAEHGTGRMVAPFVEIEWGKKAYAINKKIKQIFDPKNLFNPDVIITDDKLIHTKNIKEMPEIDDFINACMECGFCEKACPSADLSLTPRQRITITREIARLSSLDEASKNLAKTMKKEYEYLGNETCAACSQCSTLCPLEIDTANIALNLRQRHNNALASFALKNMNLTLKATKFGLKTAHLLGANENLSNQIRKVTKKFPHIPRNLPRANDVSIESTDSKIQGFKDSNPRVIYFPTCINRAFKPPKNSSDKRSIQEVFHSLCSKAKVEIIYPKNIANLCCGKAFVDFDELQEKNKQNLIDNLKEIAKDSPVILDHSACSYHAKKILSEHFKIYDLAMFIYEVLIPRLKLEPRDENIALYSMCALKKQNLSLLPLAKLCVKGEIFIHDSTYCCGFAGYKGFFTPELNKSALRNLKKYYDKKSVKYGFASSSTCEIGLNDSTQISWQHIAYLVDNVAQERR